MRTILRAGCCLLLLLSAATAFAASQTEPTGSTLPADTLSPKPATLPPSKVPPASICTRTHAPGWPVWVNGRYVGVTPVCADSVRPGSVLVEVGLPQSDSTWIRPWPTRIEVSPGQADTVFFGRMQRLKVQSEPAGATVNMDGNRVGEAPLFLLVPSEVQHRVALSLAGGAERQLVYDPRGRSDSTLDVVLETAKPPLAVVTTTRSSSWRERSRLFLPLGAVLTGVAGVWARQTADRAYTSYQRTLDVNEMGRDLNRSRRYDRVAVGCWIAAETCLATAAWTWMRGRSAP